MVDCTFRVDGVILGYDSQAEVFSSDDEILAELANASLPDQMARLTDYYPGPAEKVLDAILACWSDVDADIVTHPSEGPLDPDVCY